MPKAEEALISLVMEKLIERVATATENADWTPGQRSAALQLMTKVMDEDKDVDAVVLVRVLADGRIATGGASRKMRDGALAEMACLKCIEHWKEQKQARVARGIDKP